MKWFGNRQSSERAAAAASETSAEPSSSPSTVRVATADTAHLIGLGRVKLVGAVPTWQPVVGPRLQLHPQYLRRVFCYGNVDFSTAVLRLLWRKGTQVIFLSPAGNSLMGKLQPGGDSPNLQRLQDLAAANASFAHSMAQEFVLPKIES